jgi:hypothetical protein
VQAKSESSCDMNCNTAADSIRQPPSLGRASDGRTRGCLEQHRLLKYRRNRTRATRHQTGRDRAAGCDAPSRTRTRAASRDGPADLSPNRAAWPACRRNRARATARADRRLPAASARAGGPHSPRAAGAHPPPRRRARP